MVHFALTANKETTDPSSIFNIKPSPRLGQTKINILSRTGAAASETETSSSPMLTREQFLKLAKGPFKAQLSPELFEDTEIRAFLIRMESNPWRI